MLNGSTCLDDEIKALRSLQAFESHTFIDKLTNVTLEALNLLHKQANITQVKANVTLLSKAIELGLEAQISFNSQELKDLLSELTYQPCSDQTLGQTSLQLPNSMPEDNGTQVQ
jgi:hypothetical protein